MGGQEEGAGGGGAWSFARVSVWGLMGGATQEIARFVGGPWSAPPKDLGERATKAIDEAGGWTREGKMIILGRQEKEIGSRVWLNVDFGARESAQSPRVARRVARWREALEAEFGVFFLQIADSQAEAGRAWDELMAKDERRQLDEEAGAGRPARAGKAPRV